EGFPTEVAFQFTIRHKGRGVRIYYVAVHVAGIKREWEEKMLKRWILCSNGSLEMIGSKSSFPYSLLLRNIFPNW
ncbi:MAG: hypothetical protein QF408_09680, partial [Pirellulales bacterium]|nr:hypothetical protein [Pirellulales bacterium]